jgi:glycosyltransferase involved in cell wall biosynthesis
MRPVISNIGEAELYLLYKNLEIFIITYNRADNLLKTLIQLQNSPFSFCKITVLDNKSNDSSHSIALKQKENFKDLNVIVNKINIGANANVIRAVELSECMYTWVLCDDDFYDFSNVLDVIQAILGERADLIHMGAHDIRKWHPSGVLMTPKQLLAKGYKYFLFGSFLGCNLFRTETFYSQIINAYNNSGNMYPHMPMLFDFYLKDKFVYVSNSQIVKAKMSGQSYGFYDWLTAWINTCLLLDPISAKIAFYDQLLETSHFGLMKNLALHLAKKKTNIKLIISLFLVTNRIDNFYLFFLIPTAKMFVNLKKCIKL